MARTAVEIDADDEAWLEHEAHQRGETVAVLVREAVHEYRQRREQHEQVGGLPAALARTAGLWRAGDALAWQERLRTEWSREW